MAQKVTMRSSSGKDLSSILTTQQIKLSNYTGDVDDTEPSRQRIPSSTTAVEALGMCKIHREKYEQCCEKCIQPVCNKCKKELHKSHSCVNIPEFIDLMRQTLSLELNELRLSVIPCFVELLNDEQNLPTEVKVQLEKVRTKLQAQHQKIATQNDRILKENLQIINKLEKQTEAQLRESETVETKLSRLIRITDQYEERIASSDFKGFLIFMRERPAIEDLMVMPESQAPPPPIFIPGKVDRESLSKQFGTLKVNEDRNDQQKRLAKKCILAEPYLLDTLEADIYGSLFGITCAGRGRAWVRGDNSVVKLVDKTGKVWEQINTGDGENEPNDLELNPKGDVVISNWVENRVQKVYAENTPIEIMNTENWIPRGLCFADDGTFYVTLQRGWEAKVQWNKELARQKRISNMMKMDDNISDFRGK